MPYATLQDFGPAILRRPRAGLGDITYHDFGPCPVCGRPAVQRCKCRLADARCSAGHSWCQCPVHGPTLSITPADGSHPVCSKCGSPRPASVRRCPYCWQPVALGCLCEVGGPSLGEMGKLKLPKVLQKIVPSKQVSFKRVFPEKLRKQTTAFLQEHGGKLVMAAGLVATLIPVVGWVVGPLVSAGGAALDQAQQARLAARIAKKKQGALEAAKARYESGELTEDQYKAEVEKIAGSVAAEVLAEEAAAAKATVPETPASAPTVPAAPEAPAEARIIKGIKTAPGPAVAPPAPAARGAPAWVLPAAAAVAAALLLR